MLPVQSESMSAKGGGYTACCSAKLCGTVSFLMGTAGMLLCPSVQYGAAAVFTLHALRWPSPVELSSLCPWEQR